MPDPKPLQPLLVSSEDAFQAAGTSVALQTLFQGLKERGQSPRILCRDKFLPTDESRRIPRNQRLETWIGRITMPMGLNDLHAISSYGIKKLDWYRESDVLHFHGLHGHYFNFMALPSLTKDKPAVWTLHDIWAMTGHCSMFFDCERWKTGCGKCPYPETHPAIKRDATRFEWKLKRDTYRKSKITLIVASKWMQDILPQSMLSHLPVARIPYGIDLAAFQPKDKESCRRALGVPAGHKVLLFSAHNVMESRKGCDVLIGALEKLPDSLKREITLVIMGFNAKDLAKQSPVHAIPLGYAAGDPVKSLVYSAADLYVCPTRAETFGLTLVESLACGTPVAASDVGPVSEIVQEGRTGYLFPLAGSARLAERIVEALSDPARAKELGENGHRFAQNYSIGNYVNRHIDLYRSLTS